MRCGPYDYSGSSMGWGCQKGKSRYYEILHFVQDDRGEKARMTGGGEGEDDGRGERRGFVVHKRFFCVVFLGDGVAGVGVILVCRRLACYLGGL